jgi:hypothetical protein
VDDTVDLVTRDAGAHGAAADVEDLAPDGCGMRRRR